MLHCYVVLSNLILEFPSPLNHGTYYSMYIAICYSIFVFSTVLNSVISQIIIHGVAFALPAFYNYYM